MIILKWQKHFLNKLTTRIMLNIKKLKGYNNLDIIINNANYLKLWKYKKLYKLEFIFKTSDCWCFESLTTNKRIYFEFY